MFPNMKEVVFCSKWSSACGDISFMSHQCSTLWPPRAIFSWVPPCVSCVESFCGSRLITLGDLVGLAGPWSRLVQGPALCGDCWPLVGVASFGLLWFRPVCPRSGNVNLLWTGQFLPWPRTLRASESCCQPAGELGKILWQLAEGHRASWIWCQPDSEQSKDQVVLELILACWWVGWVLAQLAAGPLVFRTDVQHPGLVLTS